MHPIAMPPRPVTIQGNAPKRKHQAMNFSLHLGRGVFIFFSSADDCGGWIGAFWVELKLTYQGTQRPAKKGGNRA
jgi:hypothetical protein